MSIFISTTDVLNFFFFPILFSLSQSEALAQKEAHLKKLVKEREGAKDNAEALGGYARELESRLERANADVEKLRAMGSSSVATSQVDGSGSETLVADEPGQQRLVERVLELQGQCDSLRHDLHASEMKALSLAAQLREGTAGIVLPSYIYFFSLFFFLCTVDILS